MFRDAISITAGVVLCLALCSCGPNKQEPGTVTGQVALPSGFDQAASSFKAVGIYGESAVDDAGTFALVDPVNGVLPIDLMDSQGRVVLLGLVRDGNAEINVRTTAVVLLYYALGGFTIPAEHEATLYELIDQAKQTDDVAAAITVCLAGDPLAITNGDERITDALKAARAAILGEPTSQPANAAKSVRDLVAKAFGNPVAKDDSTSMLTIEPGGSVIQSGVQMLQNPAGDGIIAQNNFRRYATFLIYRTGTEDAEGQKTMLTPPVEIGSAHDVSSTSRLEFFSAITDCFTGHAPFEPVTTDPVDLPLVAGTDKTFYDVILLGPAIESSYPPIWQDTKYFSFSEDWNKQIERLNFKMFWLDFAWPAIESFLFVKGASIQNANLANFVADFKALCDKRLLNLGIYLKPSSFKEGGLALAMNLALNALKDGEIRLEFIAVVKKALTQSALNQADFEGMAKKLSGRAAASTILAAIQIGMAVGDVGAVVTDLGKSRSGEVWAVTVAPPSVRLDPDSATVTQANPSAAFTASVHGAGADAKFVYRWSTTGSFGVISDVHGQQGKSFDTTYSVVNYMADVGAIKNGDLDTVTVEVFADNGSGTIPAGAVGIGKDTSQVKGQRDEEPTQGDVWLDAYPNNQPEPGSWGTPALISAHVKEGAQGPWILRWSTSGNHGTLDGRTEKEFVTDDFSLFYYPNDDAKDKDSDWVKVEVYRGEVSESTLFGTAQITMDIWNPKTIYALCGNAQGTLYPYLGSGTSWRFYVVGHGPIAGNYFFARPGDKLHASLSCTHGECSFDLGPVYVRRGKVEDPPDTTVLIAAEGTYSCTPPTGENSCSLVNKDITLP
jgi:hypothetical protein